VYDFVTKNSLGIDNEESAKRNAAVLDQHAVITRHILGRVSGERINQSFYTTFVACSLDPGAMRKHGIS
jgi:hypothetical protein